MGADIHSFVERRENGKWNRIEPQPGILDYRSYAVFGFLADVRNYSCCTPISEPKGLPDDSEYLNTSLGGSKKYSYYGYHSGTAYTKKEEIQYDGDYHSCSWLTLKELLDFDYNQTFWNRRISKQISPNHWSGAALAEEGEGEMITYREHLGEQFFEDIEILKLLGAPEDVRIIFWFDN